MLSWLMGWLGASNWNYVKITVFPIIFGILAIYLFARDMNIMLLGEDEAKTLGVSVEKVKWTLLILASFITAAAVSFSGIIMFVGLIIPHMMRILVGPDHRTLIPASAFGGGIFLILADALARMISEMLPVGIITAFFGAPFFIYLLRSRKRGYHAIGG
jgi:iron complex transport system permease protein